MTDSKTPKGTAGGLVGKLVGRARGWRARVAETAGRKRRQAQERREANKRQAAQATRRRRNAAAPSAARSEMAITERARPMLWRIAVQRTADEARRLRAATSNTKAEGKG